MPTFILAGYPRNLVNEVKKAVAGCSDRLHGWTSILEPGDKHGEAFITKKHAERLIQRADDLRGAHVFAVTGRGEPHWEAVIRPYFRLRQIPMAAVGQTASGHYDALQNALTAAVEEENFWIEKVQPHSASDPLILPPNFAANRELATMWQLAEGYNSARNLEAAADKVEQFRRQYRKAVGTGKTPWVDDDAWIWDDSGARHGNPLFPEDWKYSYRLPDGFHFDVSHARGKGLRFLDVQGRRHACDEYLNVTSHGKVRGA